MKTTRTKALSISPAVRKAVYERDAYDGAPCCCICGSPYMISLAHYRARSQGGKGVEENLVTMCLPHHQKADHGYPDERREMLEKMRDYLMSKYDSWSEEDLTYKQD